MLCDDCSSCFSPCLTLKGTQSIGLADLLSSSIYMTYPHFFAQPPGETSHDYRLVSRRQPQPPRRPRRILGARGETALHRAAWNGDTAVVEQLISAGGHGGRGRPWRPWPWKGFRVVFGSGSDEVTEGVRTLAGGFRAVLWDVEWYSYLLFKDPLL